MDKVVRCSPWVTIFSILVLLVGKKCWKYNFQYLIIKDDPVFWESQKSYCILLNTAIVIDICTAEDKNIFITCNCSSLFCDESHLNMLLERIAPWFEDWDTVLKCRLRQKSFWFHIRCLNLFLRMGLEWTKAALITCASQITHKSQSLAIKKSLPIRRRPTL